MQDESPVMQGMTSWETMMSQAERPSQTLRIYDYNFDKIILGTF